LALRASQRISIPPPAGETVFHIFGALAEFEREEREQVGLESAQSRRKVGGRPKILSAKEVQMLQNMASDKSLRVSISAKPLVLAGLRFTGM
jgi:hypothetical protein